MELMNKKGFFFTLLVMTFVTIVLVSSIFVIEAQERKSIQKRIQTMNSFLISAEEDLQRNAYIAGYRSIFVMNGYVASKVKYITNLNATFREVFFNGSLYGEPQPLMDGANFSAITRTLQNKSALVQINIMFYNTSVEVYQIDPWKVTVNLTTLMVASDFNNLAYWIKNLSVSADVPLFQFEDTVYLVETEGKVTRKIRKTPYSVFYDAGTGSANLFLHVQGKYYKASTTGPSFLMRLEGNLGSSPAGIESFVDLQELSSQGIPAIDKASMDYIYFNSSKNPSTCTITDMPPWFRFDDSDNHPASYPSVPC